MNYQLHYNLLIQRAPNKKLKNEFREKHHIVPICLGGTNDKTNLVWLLPEEHYLAHQLLVKIYPNNQKLIYAAKMMTVDSNGNRVNNKLYGWLKRKYSLAMKGNNYGSINKGKSNRLKGIKLGSYSEERKAALRKPKTTTVNMSIAAKNRKPTNSETKAKISASMKLRRQEKFWSTSAKVLNNQ